MYQLPLPPSPHTGPDLPFSGPWARLKFGPFHGCEGEVTAIYKGFKFEILLIESLKCQQHTLEYQTSHHVVWIFCYGGDEL